MPSDAKEQNADRLVAESPASEISYSPRCDYTSIPITFGWSETVSGQRFKSRLVLIDDKRLLTAFLRFVLFFFN